MDPMLNNADPNKRPTAVMDIQPPKPVPAPEQPVELVQAPVEDEQFPAESAPALDTPVPAEPLAAQPKESHHSRTPILAIILAVIIAGSLAAFAIFTYTDSKDKKTATNETTQQANTQPKATTADVDTATTEVDTAMSSVDENADFDDNSISDTALGL